MKKIYEWINRNPFLFIGLILAVVGIIIALNQNNKRSGSGNNLASCLKHNGAKMYGSAHCGYCNQQKAMLGNSPDIPYIECLDKDGRSTQECFDLNITGYPTWIFKNGKRITGYATLDQLKQNAGC